VVVVSVIDERSWSRREGADDSPFERDAMYISIGIVFAIILVMASPFIWIAWWLLGKRAAGACTQAHAVAFSESLRRVA